MSFLGDFCAYLRSRTDSPPDFFLHAGMVALSVAVGSKVFCDGWSRPIYPNLWVVNIAPSGYGKSVAIDIAESLVERAGLADKILPGSFSQEGLIRHLAKTPQGAWFLQEFSVFLAALDRGYNEGAQQWLTEVFDVPAQMPRVLTSERIVLQYPCISILGASSPAWFASAYKESALRGGFLARFLFCPAATPGSYVGHPGPRDEEHEQWLASHLSRARELVGGFDMSAIRADFREWDEARRVELRESGPPEFAGMRSRAGMMVLKAAMLFHVSDDPTTKVLTDKDLRNAIKYVESAHAKAEKFLTEEVANDVKGQHRLKLIDILRRQQGQTDWSTALKRSKLDRGSFKDAVLTLKDMGDLTLHYEGRTAIITLLDFSRPPEFPNSLGTGNRNGELGNGQH